MKGKSESAPSSLLVSCVWCLVGFQIVLGVLLSTRYSSELGLAHKSVADLRKESVFGVLASIHYWASALCLCLAWTNLFLQVWNGRFTRDARWAWWSTVGLAVVLLAIQMTGNLLPLSYHDARTAMAEAQIAGGVPWVGNLLAKLALGGDTVSQLTLDKWYFAHRIVLPGLLFLLAIPGFKSARSGFPSNNSKWLVFLPIVFVICLGVAFSAPFGPGATATDLASGATKAMWYVLPIHGLLLYFSSLNSSLGWIGATLVPSLLLVFAIAVPMFLKAENALTRALGRLVVAISLVMIVLFSLSYGKGVQSPFGEPVPESRPASVSANDKPLDVVLAKRGDELFHSGPCKNCHSVRENNRGKPGPILKGIGREHTDAEYFMLLIRDPASKGFSRMPAFGDLPAADVRALAEYLRSLK